ncbi:MAG: hypothetical protein K2X69_07930 [Silvanigrellaceae bacterium]|nr:hypothetical protein [Silvanigrellaceae bacterium]
MEELVKVFKKKSSWQIWKQNFGNYFVLLRYRLFNKINEIRFYENEIGLVGWKNEYKFPYNLVEATIISTKISAGVAARFAFPFTRKLFVLEAGGQKFIFSVSGNYPDFEKNSELLEGLTNRFSTREESWEDLVVYVKRYDNYKMFIGIYIVVLILLPFYFFYLYGLIISLPSILLFHYKVRINK